MFVTKVKIQKNIFLPQNYPASVKNRYLEYSIWNALQYIFSSAAGVLST
jgi:hypothetical protein